METKTSTLAVEGMTCPSCIAHVQRALSEVDGITSVDVRLRERIVRVKHLPSTSVEGLLEALGEAGYPASLRP